MKPDEPLDLGRMTDDQILEAARRILDQTHQLLKDTLNEPDDDGILDA